MNVSGNETNVKKGKVLSLLDHTEMELPDPLRVLLEEGQVDGELFTEEWEVPPPTLKQYRYPDETLIHFSDELEKLRLTLKRTHFYITELRDLLP